MEATSRLTSDRRYDASLHHPLALDLSGFYFFSANGQMWHPPIRCDDPSVPSAFSASYCGVG